MQFTVSTRYLQIALKQLTSLDHLIYLNRLKVKQMVYLAAVDAQNPRRICFRNLFNMPSLCSLCFDIKINSENIDLQHVCSLISMVKGHYTLCKYVLRFFVFSCFCIIFSLHTLVEKKPKNRKEMFFCNQSKKSKNDRKTPKHEIVV